MIRFYPAFFLSRLLGLWQVVSQSASYELAMIHLYLQKIMFFLLGVKYLLRFFIIASSHVRSSYNYNKKICLWLWLVWLTKKESSLHGWGTISQPAAPAKKKVKDPQSALSSMPWATSAIQHHHTRSLFFSAQTISFSSVGVVAWEELYTWSGDPT